MTQFRNERHGEHSNGLIISCIELWSLRLLAPAPGLRYSEGFLGLTFREMERLSSSLWFDFFLFLSCEDAVSVFFSCWGVSICPSNFFGKLFLF